MRSPLPNHDYSEMLQEFVALQLVEHVVYKNNYLSARTNALHNNFPLLKVELGARVFSTLAQVYAQHFSSRCWDINLYGNEFAEFVHAQQNSGLNNHYDWPAAAWVADIEYHLLCLYYSESPEEVPTIELPTLYPVTFDYMLTIFEQLHQHHLWINFEGVTKACLPSIDKVSLKAERYLDNNGFSMLLHVHTSGTVTNPFNTGQ